jgi:transposase
LREVVKGGMKLKQAAKLMHLSYRQAKRIKARYLTDDLAGLMHQNRGRKPPNAFSETLRKQILRLHEEQYFDFNDTHFTQKLEQNEGLQISRESVRKLLRAAGKPPKRKRRPRRHRRRRTPKERPGVMVQWDGSPHPWFGADRPACCLLSAVDDATGILVAALFVPAESSEGYLRLLAMMLHRHGIPLSIYHDRHSTLVRTDDFWTLEEQLQGCQYPTHVGRVLEELGIESIPAYSPQAKGRIERGFGVLQDRMIAEMRLQNIRDIKRANEWLDKDYLDQFNKQFAKKAQKRGSAFVRISKRQIYQTVCYAYEAAVGNDNCVRLGGLIIDIPPGKNKRSYAHKKVLVQQHLDGAWSVWLDDQKIADHKATAFREPVRSWKRRAKSAKRKTKEAIQVYIASKPAPPKRGHFPFALKGTY